MKHHNELTLSLKKTTLKNLSLDKAVIPNEMTKNIAGGANDTPQYGGVNTPKLALAASTNITITSSFPRV